MTMGPFETYREAQAAAVALAGPAGPDTSVLSAEQNRQLLMGVCADAGVVLGEYDSRILSWLAGFEDATCAVVAGLIARARGKP